MLPVLRALLSRSLFGIISLWVISVSGQYTLETQNNYPLRTITVNDGLSANGVFGITQDTTGFLYFACPDGINKWDGNKFTFYSKNFVSETDIIVYDKKVFTDSEGQIWIITGEGFIEKYDSVKDRFNPILNIPGPKTVGQDAQGKIYIGTSGAGLYRIDQATQDTLQLFDIKDIPEQVMAMTSYEDALWTATSNGIYRFKNNLEYEFIISENPIPWENTSITSSERHGLWVGTFEKGLLRYDPNLHKMVVEKSFYGQTIPEDLYIHSLMFDSKERLWVGTYGQGVYVLDFETGKLDHLISRKNDDESLTYDATSALFEDHTGTIWIGTDGGGVSYYDAYATKFKKLETSHLPGDMNINMVKSMAMSPDQTLWVSTHTYGLFELNTRQQTIRNFTKTNSELRSNKLQFIRFIGKDLWIANESNEIQVRKASGSWKIYNKTSTPPLDISYIYEIFVDSNGQIWLTTSDDGLVRFDPEQGVAETFSHHPEKMNSLSSDLIFSIREDHQKKLWLGTKYKGLNSLDLNTREIIRYPEIESMVRTIYVDRNNHLWLGTNGEGLLNFVPETRSLRSYTKEDGLAGNVIYSILPENDHIFWRSSNSGLTRLDVKNNISTNYGQFDGLQSLEFNDSAGLIDSLNQVFYFGGTKGLNWFDPGTITSHPVPPNTIISGFDVFAEKQPLVSGQKLKHDKNTVTFSFAGLHFSQPEDNSYKYRLTGIDRDWVFSNNTTQARYPNLEPGNYEFQVTSSNYDGIWDLSPASFHFTVLKPWYLTNLAKLGYIMTLLLVLYGVYYYFKWRWQLKLKLAYEYEEKERLQKLDELKNRLYTNISHEIRTPLTLISGPVEQQLSKKGLEEQDKKQLTLVKRSADRLLNLVNQMLDLSKLESGNLELHIRQDNLKLFLSELLSSYEFKAREKGIEILSKIEIENTVWFDRDALEKILSNLLSNAIKYSTGHDKVNFEVDQQGDYLMVSVTNETQVLRQQDLSTIFDRFYQADKNNDGAGIGLSLVKELTTRLHGTITVQLDDENRVRFTVNIPVAPSYFNPQEVVAKTDQEKQVTAPVYTTSESKKPRKKKDLPTMLIVDDYSDIRQYIASIFKNDFNIAVAENGKEGVKKALELTPDIIISDIMMPVMDGIELCNSLKHDITTSHVPIILLTAKSGEQHEIEGLKTGADAYISKPFNREKLRVTANKLIELRVNMQRHYSKTLSINPDIPVTSTENQFLQHLKNVLDTQLVDSQFTAERFCEAMSMSRTQLHRKLHAVFGMSTTEFIRSQRLKIAADLLKETDSSVSEIAYQVGFSTPPYFNRCFKETFGLTPSEFKIQYSVNQ